MTRILFVDDEDKVLAGLRRALRTYRTHWDMHFALGGQAALEAIEAEPFDVVVSDMVMPGMDGATLLGRVRDRCPDTIRIILSGHTELRAAINAVPVAHQFLAKPCDAGTLRAAIERACRLRDDLGDPALRSAIGELDALPALPRTYSELTKLLADPEVSQPAVAAVIERDPGMCAKILQVVNSAFFGLPRRISNVGHAVSYLGTNLVSSLVLTIGIFQSFESGEQDGAGLSLLTLQNHAILTGGIARRLFADQALSEDAFTCGMLHDIGRLVMAARMQELLARIQAYRDQHGGSDRQAEKAVMGFTHAEIGGYLLGLWGLPSTIVEAVTLHHAPDRAATRDGLDLPTAVHVADALAHFVTDTPTPGATGGGGTRRPDIDAGHLEARGLTGRLPEWIELAAELAATNEDDAA